MNTKVTSASADCPLCRQDGGLLLFSNADFRVVEVDDADYPGFTRVIWNDHVAEMTDLSPSQRDVLMRAVWTVEQVQRDVFQPDKINVASLGNMVAHLHWHVIPRWRGDRHFPDAVWAAPRIAPGLELPDWRQRMARLNERLPTYRQKLIEALGAKV
jgi:diadenosine tetraphosphate (Ap4A) HIT family hydrolase